MASFTTGTVEPTELLVGSGGIFYEAPLATNGVSKYSQVKKKVVSAT